MSWWDEAVGRSSQISRIFTDDDLRDYGALAQEPDTLTLVPEPLIAGLFSTLLGVHLPGPGTNYLKQQMRFHAAAHVGELLQATVTITSVRADKRLVRLDTRCALADGVLVCDGEALVLAGGVTARDHADSAREPGGYARTQNEVSQW